MIFYNLNIKEIQYSIKHNTLYIKDFKKDFKYI